MNFSSGNPSGQPNEPESEIAALIARLLPEKPILIQRLRGGANNAVWHARTPTQSFVAKCYSSEDMVVCRRLETEFAFSSFLWNNGLRRIPRPHICDSVNRIAIFEFIAGQQVESSSLVLQDIDELAAFLGALRTMTSLPSASLLQPASERCFCIADYVENIERRRIRLEVLRSENECGPAADAMCFLANNFDPVFHQVRRRVEAQQMTIHAHSEELHTLSPSDHGFHNALRTADGLRFIDFEYAGWDDPAKMIADALHQPSVPIPPTWRTHFVTRALQHWHSADLVFERIILVEPLVCLNWVLLMLNVFLSDVRRRRESASFGPVTADVMKTKLAAASVKLKNVDEISHQLQAEK